MYNYSTYTGLVFYLALTKMTVLRQIKRTLWTLLSMMRSVRGMQSKRRKRENWCWWLQAGRGEAEVSGPAPRSLVRAPQGWTDSDAAQWCTGESVHVWLWQWLCPLVYRWVCPVYGCNSDTAQWCTGESVWCMTVTVTLPSGVQVSLSYVWLWQTVPLPSGVQVSLSNVWLWQWHCPVVYRWVCPLYGCQTVPLPSGVQVSLSYVWLWQTVMLPSGVQMNVSLFLQLHQGWRAGDNAVWCAHEGLLYV